MSTNNEAKSISTSAGSNRVMSSIAKLILSVVAGVPLRSAEHFLPTANEQATPYLGI
ncbi:hypothetical protein [Methylobacterium gnaphalii]|uniref:hypothetical protein n=1 Tax=Methylobacterium gnaphalii TaxID=1010610 RepID=UPI0014791B4E|nr:hypothetical protein [Methylobacterium gnaphalii]